MFLKVFWQKALPCETMTTLNMFKYSTFEHGQTCQILFLSQEEYVLKNLHKFHMETCKPIATPLLAKIHYTKDMMSFTYVEEINMALVPFANAIGSVMYLAICTR
jgi:hypothetical protein